MADSYVVEKMISKKWKKCSIQLCGDNKIAKERLLLIACVFHDTNGWFIIFVLIETYVTVSNILCFR